MFPAGFIHSLRHVCGFDEAAFEEIHASGKQVVSIRLNPAKPSNVPYINSSAHKVPWSSTGYYLSERPLFTLDPLLHAGAYYVQEASSMFLEQVMRQSVDLTQPLKVLDLCAAPGGKSTLLQSILSKESLLVCNELIRTRSGVLVENMAKWGAENVIVTNNEAAAIGKLEGLFDVIVVDAPCSGSGLFRKDPGTVTEWSSNNVTMCSLRQQKIITDIMPALKQGGVLIYSTCSFSQEEDEDVVECIIKEFEMESLRIEINKEWGIVESNAASGNSWGYRFFPDKVQGEGFYIAALKKTRPELEVQPTKPDGGLIKLNETEAAAIKPCLAYPDHYSYFQLRDSCIVVPSFMEKELMLLYSMLYLRKAGINVGTLIRDALIPAHELALSTAVAPSIQYVEVDRETALNYLRLNTISLDTPVKGWALIRYCGLNLGWVKILSNRINNYYPREWRIVHK